MMGIAWSNGSTPPVQLRADELHLNSLRRAQHYISFAHHIIPDYISCSFYILPLYNSFSLHGTLHYSSFLFQIFLLHYNSGRREPQCATVYTFGPASICTAANRHVIIICQTEQVINQMWSLFAWHVINQMWWLFSEDLINQMWLLFARLNMWLIKCDHYFLGMWLIKCDYCCHTVHVIN